MTVFTADGAYISCRRRRVSESRCLAGTGQRTAGLTIILPGVEEETFAGMSVVRALIEVDETGDSFTAQYTGEFVTPDGTETRECGPGTATATRITVEEMGTPAGPIQVLFEGKAAATPPRNQDASPYVIKTRLHAEPPGISRRFSLL